MENQTARLAIFDGVFCTGRATRTVWKRVVLLPSLPPSLRSQWPAVTSTQPILRAGSHLQTFPPCDVCHEANFDEEVSHVEPCKIRDNSGPCGPPGWCGEGNRVRL